MAGVQKGSAVLAKKDKQSSRIYRVIYAIFSGIVGLIFNIRVINAQNEPDEGGFLVCANHVSATDAVVVAYAFRKHQIRLMAKKELFKIPVLAQLIKLLGAFPVDRSGSDVGAIKGAVAMLKEGKCVGMFPQGHRYVGVDPATTPTKNGAALISTRAGADVVPVYIWRKNNTFRIFKRTYVIIGEKMPFADMAYDSEATGEYKRITDKIFARVCEIGAGFDPKDAKK